MIGNGKILEINKQITDMHEKFVSNAAKFHAGNQAAGRRARKASLELEKLLKQWRAASTGRDGE